MNYKFKVGELVRVYQSDIGLITARRPSTRSETVFQPYRRIAPAAMYTILRGGTAIHAWEHELRKVSESNEL